MSWTRRMWMVLAVWMALSCAAEAHARVIVVPPRPGQVGLGLSGLYGTLLQTGDFGDNFGSGPGVAVRLRYRMRFERGFGLTFESHGYDPRSDAKFKDSFTDSLLPPGGPFTPKSLTLQLFGVDFYQMSGTRTRTTRMLSVGAGLARASRALNDGETDYPGDGFYVSAGAGVERFFWQSWAYDLGARYHAIFQGGRANHDLQVSAGLVFYASL
ncbi:MAG: outer membrane beta-barrel protein [Candidatus Eisenbacteria bacterium]|nr:outer membrane beta-barrel protein [Candidatus Eisenbacteria bacterium]